MHAPTNVHELARWQGHLIRWMFVLSLVLHGGIAVMGSFVSSWFPSGVYHTAITVELTNDPMSTLPEQVPAPPQASASPAQAEAPKESSRARKTAPSAAPSAQRWLEKLDAKLGGFQESAVAQKEGRRGSLAVRRWENDAPPKPGDFAPAVAPDRGPSFREHVSSLESRIRRSGRPGIGKGEEIEAAVMFGGVGSSTGEPIPDWIREMIRNRVRGYLPELEAAYSGAFRRDQELKGKLVVRFRIGPSGRVQHAEQVDETFTDAAFATTVLEKIRRWTFDPPGGLTVEVLYPFLFIAPS